MPLREEITKTFLRLSRRGASRAASTDASAPTIIRPPSREGRDFGSYRILRQLGAGGMGEVYLALDTRLGRRVALKFLPADLTSNRAMLARFEQEARTASALNHPNILTIYEIGEMEGEHFIAGEYIDGITLGAAMERGPLEPATMLDVAIQVASALMAAHAAGIVHRDLKPGNIMLRSDGYVKVIDFGLAKRALRSGEDTAKNSWTRTGSVMGTAAYMSPEQARGEEVDHRTDLWSLGVVLYEMTARRRPFEGETESHVVVAILEQPPQPIPPRIRPLPSGIANIITRALSKDRSKRYQTARDMLADLQQVAHASGLASGIRPVALSPPSKRSRKFAVLFGVLSAAIGLAVWFWSTRGPDWFRIESVRQLTFNGRTRLAAISPDGKYLAFVVGDSGGIESLYLKQVDQASEQLKIPARKIDYEGLTFSPDSQTIFEAEKDQKFMGRLYAVPVLGERPSSPVLVDIDGPISFSPEGDRFSFVRREAGSTTSWLETAAHDGSARRRVFSVHDIALSAWQAWSPQGNRIATFLLNYAKGEVMLDLVSTNGTESRRVLPEWRAVRQPVWTSRSNLLVPAAMRSQGANQAQLKEIALKNGQIHDLTKDLAGYNSASITRDGESLVAVKTEIKANLWISAQGDPTNGQSAPAETGDKPSLAWSDDQHIIVSSDRNGFPNLAEFNIANQDRSSLTNEPYTEAGAAVVPGTRWVVFGSPRSGGFHLWKFDPESNAYTQLTSGPTYDETPAVSPDGKSVVYTSSLTNQPHLRKTAIAGGPSTQIGSYLARYPEISPDGKWIACELQDPNTRRLTVAVIAFDGHGAPRAIPNAQSPVRWSPDGSSLTSVLTNDRGVSNLWNIPLDGSPPRQLTHFEDETILTFAWSPQGDRLACIRGSRGADVVLFKRQK